MENVKKLVKKRNVTALMVVHALNLASKYSDRILMLKDGKIVAAGEPSAVMTIDNIANVYEVEAHVHTLFDIPYVMPLKQIGAALNV